MDSQPTAPYDTVYEAGSKFRLHEIREIERELEHEIRHYRLVQKKYKKARKVSHFSAVGLGLATVGLSSGSLAGSFTGVGIVVGAPVAGLAASFGLASTTLAVVCKALERKVNKHTQVLALATAKHDSVSSIVSAALTHNTISDSDYRLILDEKTKYLALKENLRAKYSGSTFSLEKLRGEIWEELQKKIPSHRASRRS